MASPSIRQAVQERDSYNGAVETGSLSPLETVTSVKRGQALHLALVRDELDLLTYQSESSYDDYFDDHIELGEDDIYYVKNDYTQLVPVTLDNGALEPTTVDVRMLAPRLYVVSVLSEGGSVTFDPPGGAYAYGTHVTMTAVADEHYHFDQWSDGPFTEEKEIVVTGTASYTANFLIDTYTTIVDVADGDGTVELSHPQPQAYGDELIITAIPDEGNNFVSWSGDVPAGHETDNPLTLIVEQDRNISATFEVATFSLTLGVSHGSGLIEADPDLSEDIPYGTVIELTATPDELYVFQNWEGDVPEGHENDNPLTIVMNQDRDIQADFEV